MTVIGGAGGGGSSTGAGFGGNGSPPALQECLLTGSRQGYVVTIGTGGAKGAVGLSGSSGTNSIVATSGGGNQCSGPAGNGVVNGTASNGAGGPTATQTDTAQVQDSATNIVGIAYRVQGTTLGTTGGAAVTGTFVINGRCGVRWRELHDQHCGSKR